MNFGVPKELRPFEYRVGLTPAAVDALVRADHQVYIEKSAGINAGFRDEEYESVGGNIVYTAREAYGRADVVVKVSRPTEEDYKNFSPGQAIMSFLHLESASPDLYEAFKKNEITAIANEMVQDEDGMLTILYATSELAGRLSPIIAGQLMQNIHGGKGILLSGIPGTPPATVVVIGAGVLGSNAARSFHNLGAEVVVLDKQIKALQRIDNLFGGKISTMISNPFNISKAISFSDVLVCAATVPGERAPRLITRSMLRSMRSKSILMDFSINNGGCVETSRPTTIANPSYIEEGIIHFCVPNAPALVSRTASYALSNALLPYLLDIGHYGVEEAIKAVPDIKRGVNLIKGKIANPKIAAALGAKLEVKL